MTQVITQKKILNIAELESQGGSSLTPEQQENVDKIPGIEADIDTLQALTPLDIIGDYDVATNTPDITTTTMLPGKARTVTVAGTRFGITFNVGDLVYRNEGDTAYFRQVTGSEINDITLSTNTTYSSQKIENRLNEEADKSLKTIPATQYKKGFDGYTNTLSFSDANREITINATSEYQVWIKSKPYKINANFTKQISIDIGLHIIYFDVDINNNVIIASQVNQTKQQIDNIILNYSLIATAYWNGVKFILPLDERHPSGDARQHIQMHDAFGCKYIKGLDFVINIAGDGSTNANMQFSCGSGEIDDDGYRHSIPLKNLTDAIKIIYKDNSGNWTYSTANYNTFCLIGANNRPQYNSGNALIEIANNNYGISHIYSCPHIDETQRYFVVMDDNEYANVDDANLRAQTKYDLGVLPSVEFTKICSVVFSVKDNYTNNVNAKAVAVWDWRGTSQNANQITGSTLGLQSQINDITADIVVIDDKILNLASTGQVIYCDVNNGIDATGDGSKAKPFKTLAGVLATSPNFGTKQVIKFEGAGATGGGSVTMTNTTGIYIVLGEKCELNTEITMPTTNGTIYFIGGSITANITNNSTAGGMMYFLNQIKIQSTITNSGANYGEIINVNDGDGCNLTNSGAGFFSIRNAKTLNKVLNSGAGTISVSYAGTLKQPAEMTNGNLFLKSIENIVKDVNGYCIKSTGTNAGILGVDDVNFLQTDFATKGKIQQTNSNLTTLFGKISGFDETSAISGNVSFSSNFQIIQGTLAKRPSALYNAGKIYVDENGKTYYSNGATWTQITYNKSEIDTLLNAKENSITAGTATQYWAGNKTWTNFATSVCGAVLTGLSTATNAVITATDTVLSAFGKLQKQISDNLTTLTTHTGNVSNPHSVTKTQVGLTNVPNVDATNLSNDTIQGTFTASNSAIISGDDGKNAFQKAQGQINAKANNDLSNLSSATTARTNLDVYSKAEVNNLEDTYGSIFSAATMTIGSTGLADCLYVMGNTNITSLGNAATGVRRTLYFNQSLTITHNGSNLILPGGVDLAVNGGDSAEFVCWGVNQWKCMQYQNALISNDEMNCLNGVTSNIQTQLNGTQTALNLKANNDLSSLPSPSTARTNLDVYSKAEVNTLTGSQLILCDSFYIGAGDQLVTSLQDGTITDERLFLKRRGASDNAGRINQNMSTGVFTAVSGGLYRLKFKMMIQYDVNGTYSLYLKNATTGSTLVTCSHNIGSNTFNGVRIFGFEASLQLTAGHKFYFYHPGGWSGLPYNYVYSCTSDANTKDILARNNMCVEFYI